VKPYGHKTHANPGRPPHSHGTHHDCGVCGEGRARLRNKRRAREDGKRAASRGREDDQAAGGTG